MDEELYLESLTDIAKAVNVHRNLETVSEISNCAVGRVKTIFENQEMQFWLINREGQMATQRDWFGNPIIVTAMQTNKPYTKNGFTVPKNSRLGELFITNSNGSHIHTTPSGVKNVMILNRAVYEPKLDTIAEDIIIRLADDLRIYTYNILEELLAEQKSIDADKKEYERAKVENQTEDAENLLLKIEEKKRSLDKKLVKAKSFIRKAAELRYQPILDEIQEKIKRSKIFDGNLIINGGPGTGKTTSLIQRIKFLTAYTIEEYVPLSTKKKDILFGNKNSWIFFTPNALLSLFLRNSMVKEELQANDQTVKVWSDYKNILFRIYKLTDSDTKRPFLSYNKHKNKSVLPSKALHLKKFIEVFDDYFISLQLIKIERIKDIELDFFDWKILGTNIKKEVSNFSSSNFKDIFKLFFNLHEKYAEQAKLMLASYNEMINLSAAKLLLTVKKDKDRYQKIIELIRSEKQNEEENEDDDDELENDSLTDLQEIDFLQNDEKFLGIIKSIIRKIALKKYDSTVKLNSRDRRYLEYLIESNDAENLIQIGQLAFFRKFFEKLTQGIVANIFREIPTAYKKFRIKENDVNTVKFDKQILRDLVKEEKNIRLHSDEQAFILTTINKLCVIFAKHYRDSFETVNHPYIDAFRTHCKAVIGIDEATDFSLIDLICMSTFNHPDFSSVTLAGDMMQKITIDGLRSWKDYQSMTKKTTIENLEISYRQSQTLLRLAQSIFSNVNKMEATYKSYMDVSEFEPNPLVYISKNEQEKIEWIAKRILEIYKAYNNVLLPSIAIFLPSESEIDHFVKKLEEIQDLSDVLIKIKACKNGDVLGDAEVVRVYSIDKIKGLEFQAVFFHNVDQILENGINKDLFNKYLYVGLSRASFYLAMTLNNSLGSNLEYLNEFFLIDENWS